MLEKSLKKSDDQNKSPQKEVEKVDPETLDPADKKDHDGNKLDKRAALCLSFS